jgi:hypothetical protein
MELGFGHSAFYKSFGKPVSQYLYFYPNNTPSGVVELMGGGTTQVDEPWIARMHPVIDPQDNRSFVSKVRNPDPIVHRNNIAGSRQLFLAENFSTGCSPALEFICIVTGCSEMGRIFLCRSRRFLFYLMAGMAGIMRFLLSLGMADGSEQSCEKEDFFHEDQFKNRSTDKSFHLFNDFTAKIFLA